ncbi:aldehyde dehydrogenase family protein [Hydrogenibacillus sp. N12]|uniref:aldehyde dehydrogenase family protein n=1 Tax=Hydrogenibacillus sp. N12 TaxID=2866627 RepID=UPI001C7CFB5A|nr:aldehyde dehydrogenase family protein [Hydrogenibacillus sp. N12]QZA31973.1 aldehyde dehydrogenase family protein [Hydrogenibacillus sp. N12]
MIDSEKVNRYRRSYYPMFIDGEWVDAADGNRYTVYNPATGEPLAEVARAGRADIDRALQAARLAFEHGKWRHFSVLRRARVLNRIAEIMRERFDELVELEILNTGKTLFAAQGQIMQAIEDFEFYAGAIVGHRGHVNNMPSGFFNYTQREPVGVCAQIVPWNYPLMMAAWKIAPAIAAGCSVVVKPATLTPVTALVLAEIATEAGVPKGVVNVVPGSGRDVGDYLVTHPEVDKIAFTGSTPVGRHIMELASRSLKKVTLELGGKSPSLIFDDADLDAAVDGSVFGIFYNTGQSCEARSRIYVQRSVYDAFMARFVEKAKKLKLGNPFDPETHVGAVISREQVDVIDGYVRSALEDGAQAVLGGGEVRVPGFEGGYWYAPTILVDVHHGMKAVQEEIFGPVVTVMPFDTEDEAVALANDTMYGLAAAVWTKDGARAKRMADRIRAGIVLVNTPFSAFPGMPFGGTKQSGFGRELGIEALDLYTEVKSVLMYYGTKPLNPFKL